MDRKLTTSFQHLWLAKLLGFDYEIKHRKGKKNIGVDTLSRFLVVKFIFLVAFTISTGIMDYIQHSWKRDTTFQFHGMEIDCLECLARN